MNWEHFKKVDFFDKTIGSYSVDTRDFHVIESRGFESKIDTTYPDKKPEEWYHTSEELIALLNRYFEESGGEAEWRMLCLEGSGERFSNGWEMKYLRIFRFQKGLLVCTSSPQDKITILSKKILACPVNQRHLNTH